MYLELTDKQTRNFLKKVRNGMPDVCWEWSGCKDKNDGYGSFRIGSKLLRAHRVSYELCRGKIQKGLVIDHLCRNITCVNPLHLEPVTSQENVRRSDIAVNVVNSKKTHCLRGHPLSGNNLYITKIKQRNCRICRSMHWKKFDNKKKNH